MTETDASPNITDVGNKVIEDMADVIAVATNEQAVLVKNKYGKLGILTYGDVTTVKWMWIYFKWR